jgi:hypothetical protein
MFSSLSRALRPQVSQRLTAARSAVAAAAPQQQQQHVRWIQTHNPQADFKPRAPTKLNLEMAEGIQQANLLILKHGVGFQRLQELAKDNETPLVMKWQRMMEIYLGAQLHIVAALGYETSEVGIMTYTQQLAKFVSESEPTLQESFQKIGRDTWRGMLVTAFELDVSELEKREELSIVDARNVQHKVSSKLQEPAILQMVSEQCAKLPAQEDPEMEMGLKHQIIQDVVVNKVYLQGLVEELGFGSGPTGYATMQYVMSYHESDPLCQQYTQSAMIKIWQAAGLDISGAPGAAKMPMSTPSV